MLHSLALRTFDLAEKGSWVVAEMPPSSFCNMGICTEATFSLSLTQLLPQLLRFDCVGQLLKMIIIITGVGTPCIQPPSIMFEFRLARLSDLQRITTVKVKFQDLQGRMATIELDEFPARIFLHEFDHLQVSVFQSGTATYSGLDRPCASAMVPLKVVQQCWILPGATPGKVIQSTSSKTLPGEP